MDCNSICGYTQLAKLDAFLESHAGGKAWHSLQNTAAFRVP